MFERVGELCSRCFSGYEPIPEEASYFERVCTIVGRVFSHPVSMTLGAAGGATWLIVSSLDYTSVMDDYTHACVNDLNNLQGNITTCREPYDDRINQSDSFVVFSCFVLGFIIQCLWEEKHATLRGEEGQALLPDAQPAEITKWRQFQQFVKHVQTHYSYDFQIFLAYLNNGLGFSVGSASSWDRYFACQLAARSLFVAGMGMYARVSIVYILEQYNREKIALAQTPMEEQSHFLKRHWQPITWAAMGAISLALSESGAFHTSLAEKIAFDIAFMLFARSFGIVSSRWIERVQERTDSLRTRKITVLTRALLNTVQTPLVILGYYVFLQNFTKFDRALSLACIGLGQGLHDADCIDTKIVVFPSHRAQQTLKEKVWNAVKDHWAAVGVIATLIAESQTDFLRCASVIDLDCPISFDIENNYLNMSGEGARVLAAAGLSVYYARKIARWMHEREYGWQAPEFFLYALDRTQFDALSLLVYSIIRSGRFVPGYAYATYNPEVSLALLGATMANFKERSDAIRKALKAAEGETINA